MKLLTYWLIFEVKLLKCSDYLSTCDNQFGFKASHGTNMCIYTLQEFIDYYICRGTTVYVTFLDASKAFDRLNYWLLFDNLIKKHVPLFIIKLLLFWCTHQRMCVRWSYSISTDFFVGNSVKQGGIISHVWFNIYMGDLSMHLNSSGIGGYLGIAFIHHLCYADELCLISLSSSGIQQLLHICNTYAAEHQLQYNGSKSFSLCFKRK